MSPVTLPKLRTFPCPVCGEPVEHWETEFAHMMRTEYGPRGVPEHALIVGDQAYPGGFGRWTHSESVPLYNRNTMHPCGDVILGPWQPPPIWVDEAEEPRSLYNKRESLGGWRVVTKDRWALVEDEEQARQVAAEVGGRVERLHVRHEEDWRAV